MESVSMPPLERWHKVPDKLPADHEAVIGVVNLNGWTFAAVCQFRGNDFVHEFIMAGQSVPCKHWLPITVK